MTMDRDAGARLRAWMEPRIGDVQPWAEKHGIGRDTIYALWRGRDPRPSTLAAIATALGVSYMDIVRVRAGEEPQSEGPDLVAAIERQTQVLESIRELLAGRALDPELQRWAAERRAAGTPTPDPTPSRPRRRPARTGASR